MKLPYLPVRDFSSLHATAYLVPNEEILFALATADGGGGSEIVFTTDALVIATTKPSYSVQCLAGKHVERFEYKPTLVSEITLRSHLGRRGCGTSAAALSPAAQPLFTIKLSMPSYRDVVIAMQDECLAQTYYKALVMLSREMRTYRTPDFSNVHRILAHEAVVTRLASANDSAASSLLALD